MLRHSPRQLWSEGTGSLIIPRCSPLEHRGFLSASWRASLRHARRRPSTSAADRVRLEAIIGDRNSPQKHVWRARIILLTTAGLGTVEITRRASKSKTCVWRWQERFMQQGVAGYCATRPAPSRISPLKPEIAEQVV